MEKEQKFFIKKKKQHVKQFVKNVVLSRRFPSELLMRWRMTVEPAS